MAPTGTAAQEADTSASKGLVFDKETPDSVLRQKVFHFNYEPHSVKINTLEHPSLDPTGIQHPDPLDAQQGNYFLSKGVAGHPHIELFPTFADGLGASLQADEHMGYAKDPKSVLFYQTQTPYSLLSYGSSLNKDYRFHLTHTQNIIPGWNVAFDYQLINPEGPFANSAARNHYLDATSNYFSPDSRLQVLAGFIFQRFTVDENGGLSDDSYFTSGAQNNQAGLPMRLTGSQSVHLRHTTFGRVSYNWVQQVKRIRLRDSLVVRYDTLAPDSVVLVTDTLVLTDTLLPSAPRMLNAGVVGMEWNYARAKRAAYMTSGADSTLWESGVATVFWTNDAYPDHRWRNPVKLTFGLTPRMLRAELLGSRLQGASVINPFARVELTLGQWVLKGEYEMDNTVRKMKDGCEETEHHGGVSLTMPLDKGKRNLLTLSAAMQHNLPEVRMLETATQTIKGQDLVRLQMDYEREADGNWLPRVKALVRGTQLSHHWWYDEALALHQGETPLWLFQASLNASVQLGWLHLDMQQLLQHSTDKEQIDVPLWASKNSLYADMHLFRGALHLQVGVDVKYHTPFHADAYDPFTGLFYMQDDAEVGGYLWGDLFVNIQVKRASVYLKGGHLNALWEMQPGYLLLPHYPGQSFGLFWGITWRFFD